MRSLFLALISIRRNPYQSLTAIFSIFLTLFFAYTFSFILYFGKSTLDFFETQPKIIAFFKTDITNNQASESAKMIAQLDYVNDIKIITKEEGFETYKTEHQDDELLMELVKPEILPVTMEISTKNLENLKDLNQELEKNDDIEEIFYQQDVAETIDYWLDIARYSSLVIFSCLALLSLLILIIVISMKVINKKVNIKIMKNIGASNFYIRAPYLWEGILYGFFGSIFGWIASYSLIIFNQETLTSFFSAIQIFPIDYQFLGIQIAVGLGVSCFLGLIASFWAVSRMLKKSI